MRREITAADGYKLAIDRCVFTKRRKGENLGPVATDKGEDYPVSGGFGERAYCVIVGQQVFDRLMSLQGILRTLANPNPIQPRFDLGSVNRLASGR